jgi:hypothetical protein
MHVGTIFQITALLFKRLMASHSTHTSLNSNSSVRKLLNTLFYHANDEFKTG